MNEYRLQDIRVGLEASFTHSFSPKDEERFRALTGDHNPLHWDDAFAREQGEGRFAGHVCFGMLTASLLSTLAGVYLPGKYSLIHSVELSFLKPVYAGQALTVTGTVSAVHEALRMIEVKARITAEDGACVCKAKMKIILLQ